MLGTLTESGARPAVCLYRNPDLSRDRRFARKNVPNGAPQEGLIGRRPLRRLKK